VPRLTVGTELQRILAESRDETRYREIAIRVRRLTLDKEAKEGNYVDETGRAWVSGDLAPDGRRPVWSKQRGASTTALDGLELRAEDGSTARLRAEVLLEAGGVWDSRLKTFKVGPDGQRMKAERPIVVDTTPAQVDGTAWFAERLRAFRERWPHPHSAGVLYDKRRGGKTFLATLLLICFLVDCPTVDGQKTEGVLVTQSIQARDEIEQQIRDIVPDAWFTFSEMPKRQFRFTHGAKLTCRTATDPENTQAGRIDVALINEAALMPEKVFRIVGRGLQDKAGVALLTTNKPESKKGGWVARLWEGAELDAREGREPAVALLRCPEELNPYADKKAKASILRMLDYARDPDEGEGGDDTGLVAEFGDTVMAGIWDDAKHIRPLPDDLDDVTDEITRRLYGRAYPLVIGADFGETRTASVFKLLAERGNLAAAQLWALNCIVLTGGDGDEADLSEAVIAAGISMRGALWVADCSGAFEAGMHGWGPVSYAVLRRIGWEVCGSTVKKTEKAQFPKNPPIFESTQRLRSLVADGRLFVTPQAKALSSSLRKCESKRDKYGNSVPRTQTAYSHPLDTARYVGWWLTARPELLGGKPPELARVVTVPRRR
jgi:hypothetical protein